MHRAALLGLLLIAFAVVGTNALKCYQCISPYDEGCEVDSPDFKSKYLLACPGNRNNSCRKLRQNIEGNFRYVHQCSGISDEKSMKCSERIGTHKIKVMYCHCRKDGCNSGSRLSMSIGLTALVAVVARALVV